MNIYIYLGIICTGTYALADLPIASIEIYLNNFGIFMYNFEEGGGEEFISPLIPLVNTKVREGGGGKGILVFDKVNYTCVYR